MKKNDLILGIALSIYCYLFYNQGIGINVLLFTATLIACLFIKDNSVSKDKDWIVLSLGSLISGICAALYGNTLSAIANFISLSLLASVSFSKESSLIFSLIHSGYSYISAPCFMVMNYSEKAKNADADKKFNYQKLLTVLIPLIVVVVFFMMYKSANPIFAEFAKEINLDFITWPFIRFLLLGLLALYAYFNQAKIMQLFYKDISSNDKLLQNSSAKEFSLFKQITSEYSSAIILFVSLNLLLLIVNVLDMNFIFVSQVLPEGLSYSEFVHQGINLLIASIVIAILVTLYYFRGNLNFFENNKALKVLAYLWIIQNIILVYTSGMKNFYYVQEYSLTYKRIGVFVYLTLAVIGLVTTLIKVSSLKSNWFLLRKNTWTFYAVLVISCFFNWNLFIAKFNISHSKNLDKSYLLDLSNSSIPELLKCKEKKSFNVYGEEYSPYIEKRLGLQKRNFLIDMKYKDWQSWNLEDRRILKEIEKLN